MDEQNTRKQNARREVQHPNNQLLQEGRVGRYWGKSKQSHATGTGMGHLETPFARSEVQGLFHSDGTVLTQGKVRKPYPVSTLVSSCRLLNLSMAKDGADRALCGVFGKDTGSLAWRKLPQAGRGIVIEV